MTWSRRLASAALWVSLVGVGGCGGDGPGDEDGVPRLRLVEVGRIGSLEGPAALSSVADVLPDGGSVLVLERRPPSVLRYDSAGARTGTFGGEGGGPGEFLRPWELGNAGDLVWVADVGARELELFTPEGAPEATVGFQVAPDSFGAVAVPRAYLVSGHLIAGPAGTPVGAALAGALEHESFYLVDREGAVLDTLYRRPVLATDYVRGELAGGRGFMGGHPLQERPLAAFFPDGSGMVVVERREASGPGSATYRVKVWNAAGEIEADRAVPYAPVPAEGWRELEIAELRARAEGAPESQRAMLEPMVEALRQNWAPRSFYPPVTAVVAGTDGTILIRREETGADTVRWELLDRSARSAAVFWAPPDVTIEAASRHEVWAVVSDELDVPYVVRYRLEAADRSGIER